MLQKLTQSFHTHTVIVIGGVEDELLLEVKETPGLRILPHLFVSAITTSIPCICMITRILDKGKDFLKIYYRRVPKKEKDL